MSSIDPILDVMFDPDIAIVDTFDVNQSPLTPTNDEDAAPTEDDYTEVESFFTGSSAQARRIHASSQTATTRRIGHRDPTATEVRAATNFDAIQRVWQDATEELVTKWTDIRAQQIDALVTQVHTAVEAGDATALAQVTAPVIGQDVIFESMRGVVEEAITAARAEAAAQGVDIGLVNVADLEPRLASIAEAISNLLARGIGESAARQGLLRYGIDTLTASDVAAGVRQHLEDLTDQYLLDQLGGALTQAQNTGRREVMNQAQATIYSSELLDENTCDLCAEVDGTEYGDITEAESDYPTGGYAECLGGPRCRGTLVAIYGEAEATD